MGHFKKHGEESKEKMSKSRLEGLKKGNIKTWNKGYGGYMKGENNPSKRPEVRRKISESKKGKKRSNEFRGKMRKIMLENWANGTINKEERREKQRELRANQTFPKNDTQIEIKIQNFLKQLGIDFFTHQYIKDIKYGYQCDILIPSMNMIIECDGNFWHKYPIGTEKDYIRTKELLEKGFKVLRLWENEIEKMNINEFKDRLEII